MPGVAGLGTVGGAASITAFVEIAFITVAGYFGGKWMGWSTMDSLFLGGMLASSSTTIIIRAFDELGITDFVDMKFYENRNNGQSKVSFLENLGKKYIVS